MRLADEYKLESVAFPYVSTGIYQYPKHEAEPIAVGALNDFLEDNPQTTVKEIYLVKYKEGA